MFFFVLLLLLLFIAAVVVIASVIKPVEISFLLDTDRMDMHATAKWFSFARIESRIVSFKLHNTVYLFKKQVYAGTMKQRKKKRSSKALFEAMELSNTAARISYGFNEPYLTGIFCAAADFATALVRTAEIELEPAFRPDNEFLIISAQTELNVGKTLINMLENKLTRRRENYGSAELN